MCIFIFSLYIYIYIKCSLVKTNSLFRRTERFRPFLLRGLSLFCGRVLSSRKFFEFRFEFFVVFRAADVRRSVWTYLCFDLLTFFASEAAMMVLSSCVFSLMLIGFIGEFFLLLKKIFEYFLYVLKKILYKSIFQTSVFYII